MSFLSFLSEATVEEVALPSRAGVGGARKPWHPKEGRLAIRVWKDGSIYPNKTTIERFNLEYVKAIITKGEMKPYTQEDVDKWNENQLRLRDEHVQKQAALPEDQRTEYKIKEFKPQYKPSKYEYEGAPGNGFDFIDSRTWKGFVGEGKMLFVAPAAKDLAKVDIFGSTKYTGDGTPVNSVYEQGSKTFGHEVLLPAVEEVYGVKLSDEKEYVDLLIVDELDLGDGNVININEKFSKKIAHFPKKVLRGDAKGQSDYEKRENAIVWGLIPAELLGETEVEEPAAAEAVAE
jgi:hypothetical protein